MLLTTKCILLLFLVAIDESRPQERTIIRNIIKQYKKTSLRLREDDYQNNLPILDSYDYVIVGAGPSGCVLANRLSENPDVSVLLLEAGPESTMLNDVPSLNLFFFDTEYNWKFSSQYNPDVCRSMDFQTCPWPSGKGIGGGTTINALIYTRGNKQEYDDWAQQGNLGWSFEDVLKYFNKLENTRIPEFRGSPNRGSEGPLWVSQPDYLTNASSVFLKAGKELGYPEIDFNQPYKSGFATMQLSMKEGVRSSASNAYLKPVTQRANLHVAQRAMVTKVLIDPTTNTAFGVDFLKKGKKRTVMATREVILSAGAFGSPKLLMLSGIGPRDHLESLNIKVIKDLPVGDNLQEHVGATFLPFIVSSPQNFIPDFEDSFASLPIDLLNYQITKGGQPTSNYIDSLAYVSSRYATDDNPDIELMFVRVSYASDRGNIQRKTIGFTESVYRSYYKALEKYTTFSIWVMGCYPKSRGSVRLASKDPLTNPIINNNFFNHTEDLNVIIDGIKEAIKITESKAFQPYGIRLYKVNHPGCEDVPFGTDEYWGCVIRQITAQFHHQSGTCKMGPASDPTSVVDSRLRVHGVKKLRVVDASIMPRITAGHTQAPAFMIGEKAADIIKEDNNSSSN